MSIDRHQHLRLRRLADYRFAAGLSQVPLVFSELPEAAKHFPIVFPAASPTRPVALLGDRTGSNRFVDATGRWTAGYLPAYLRRYPFVLAPAQGEATDRYMVLLDRQAPHLSTEEGEPLFGPGHTHTGDPENTGGAAAAAIDFLRRFQGEADATPAWFEPLLEAGVLVERTLGVHRDGHVLRRIAGIRVADRERLAAIDDATLAAWSRDGRLEAVYSHLLSLNNLRRLLT